MRRALSKRANAPGWRVKLKVNAPLVIRAPKPQYPPPAIYALTAWTVKQVHGVAEVAAAGLAAAKPNTFRWLCVQFLISPEYKRLDPRTQYTRLRIIESMLQEAISPTSKEAFADFLLNRLSAKALRVLRDCKAQLPGAATPHRAWASRASRLRALWRARDCALHSPARSALRSESCMEAQIVTLC